MLVLVLHIYQALLQVLELQSGNEGAGNVFLVIFKLGNRDLHLIAANHDQLGQYERNLEFRKSSFIQSNQNKKQQRKLDNTRNNEKIREPTE